MTLADYKQSVIGELSPAMLFAGLDRKFYEKYFVKLYQESKPPKLAAKIIERAYSLFHHNAQNRWRRWGYVRPAVGRLYLFTYRKLDFRPITYTAKESDYYDEVEKRFIDFCSIWYPIPKF